MTSTPDYQPPPPWGPPQQHPVYDPQPSPPPEMGQSRGPGSRRFGLELSARTFIGLGALVAAVVACAAPFLRFWMESFSQTETGPRNTHLAIGGFGHYTYRPASAAAGQLHGHDTNYGLPLFIAAIVLAVAAIVLGAHKSNAVLPLLMAVIGGSMLGAIAVEALMDRASRSSFDNKNEQWSVGYGWWLMMLAGGLGAITAIAGTALVVTSSRALPTVQVQ